VERVGATLKGNWKLNNSPYFKYGIFAVTVVIFIVAWWALADLKNNFQQFAGPVQTAAALGNIFADQAQRNQLFTALGVTLTSIFFGYLVAVAVGIPIGIVMGRYLVADLFLDPWVNAWYSIPAVAFVPLTMNWTGLTPTATVVVAFLISVFSIILNVYGGIKNSSKALVDTGLAYRANQFQLLSKVILPGSLPNIMVGLRLGISRAIEGVIIAEMFFASIGIGGMIDYSADHLESATSDALIVVLAVISIVLTACFKLINRRVVAWKESEALVRE
jgi:ABC-type nitrate/sulfonate/bicarbonate transport system permease component